MTTHYQQIADELVTQEKIDALTAMIGEGELTREIGVAFMAAMFAQGEAERALGARRELERVVQSNAANLLSLEALAVTPTATAEEVAAIRAAYEALAVAFGLAAGPWDGAE